MERLKKIEMDGSEKIVQTGVSLPKEQVEALTQLLVEFREFFAWKPSDMLRTSKEVIVHEINIEPSIRLIV